MLRRPNSEPSLTRNLWSLPILGSKSNFALMCPSSSLSLMKKHIQAEWGSLADAWCDPELVPGVIVVAGSFEIREADAAAGHAER
jgi:hypothetical protein